MTDPISVELHARTIPSEYGAAAEDAAIYLSPTAAGDVQIAVGGANYSVERAELREKVAEVTREE